jgi:hypothetical protein
MTNSHTRLSIPHPRKTLQEGKSGKGQIQAVPPAFQGVFEDEKGQWINEDSCNFNRGFEKIPA